ncbi:MAG: cyclic nucleotide-binding domain-containing protein [Verrucomicrobia bacterium]|nr:cyclic nucleotide-binding domain-containing protein [Verrucomicrobiota bacterium]
MDTEFFGPKVKRSRTTVVGAAVRAARPPARNKLLAGIDPDAVEAVLRHAVAEEYRADSPPVFEAGDLGDSVYLIEKGRVRIFKPVEGGGEETFVELGPGDFFGEMALFGDHRRAASAVAAGDCVLWRLRFSALKELWGHKLELTRNLLEGAHQQLRAIDERYVQEVVQRERLGLVGRMAASIVHDLKGPLGSIRLSAELIAEDPASPETAKRTRRIVREVDRLTTMVTDLLDYSRSSSKLALEPTLLGNLLNDTFDPLRDDFEKRGVRLELNVNLFDPVVLDPHRIQRVIHNLALNAAEAMPKGGQLIVCAECEGELVRLEVRDTGHGIPRHQQAEVWKPFVTFGKKRGTGLGLSIAHKIVSDHGGTISLQSEEGKGTTFIIHVPRHGPAEPPAP